MFYKITSESYVDGIAETIKSKIEHDAISEEEYNNLLFIIRNKPTPPTGFDYKLKADTLTWELVELPPIDDTDEDATESDYITALQDLGVEV